MNSTPRYYVVDAFADRPFAGNPAAVVPLANWPANEWMQNVAMEMNLSETAFIVGGHGHYELRWFTPTTEVELCGHATLAAAHTLWSHGYAEGSTPISFETHSGTLMCRRVGDHIELDFPSTLAEPIEAPPTLNTALGITAKFTGKSQFDYLVVVDKAETVRRIVPDFNALKRIPARGFIVTAPADDERFDFVSRFFAPAAGVNEDPVTGSAHCCLSPYWTQILGRDSLVGHQASTRGGTVHVRQADDRVILGGTAVTVMQGDLLCG